MQDKEIETAKVIVTAIIAIFLIVMTFVFGSGITAHRERIEDLQKRVEALEKQGREAKK